MNQSRADEFIALTEKNDADFNKRHRVFDFKIKEYCYWYARGLTCHFL